MANGNPIENGRESEFDIFRDISSRESEPKPKPIFVDQYLPDGINLLDQVPVNQILTLVSKFPISTTEETLSKVISQLPAQFRRLSREGFIGAYGARLHYLLAHSLVLATSNPRYASEPRMSYAGLKLLNLVKISNNLYTQGLQPSQYLARMYHPNADHQVHVPLNFIVDHVRHHVRVTAPHLPDYLKVVAGQSHDPFLDLNPSYSNVKIRSYPLFHAFTTMQDLKKPFQIGVSHGEPQHYQIKPLQSTEFYE